MTELQKLLFKCHVGFRSLKKIYQYLSEFPFLGLSAEVESLPRCERSEITQVGLVVFDVIILISRRSSHFLNNQYLS